MHVCKYQDFAATTLQKWPFPYRVSLTVYQLMSHECKLTVLKHYLYWEVYTVHMQYQTRSSACLAIYKRR